MLMVIYLMVIGYYDREYKNNYYAYAHEWESSGLCTAIGVTAMISSEVCIYYTEYWFESFRFRVMIDTFYFLFLGLSTTTWFTPSHAEFYKTLVNWS